MLPGVSGSWTAEKMKESWILPNNDTALVKRLSSCLKLDENIISVLLNRGYRTTAEITGFLNPHHSQMHSPYLMAGIEEAVTLIRSAIERNIRIGIFADSDLDGITSLTLMLYVLSRFSDDILYRFPQNAETYGLTCEIIDEFHSAGVKLILTVDSGIRDCGEISYARSKGIDVIVTDHHEPDAVLPDAVIVNPRQAGCGYPYKNLAGVGVAFKLCHGFLMSFLPSHNTVFALLSAEKNRINIVLIRNGIVESENSFESDEEAKHYLGTLHGPLHFIGENSEILKRMECAGNREAHTLQDLLPNNFKIHKNVSAFTDIARAFSLKSEIQNVDMELFVKLFFEVQRINSPKLMKFFRYALSLVSIGNIADVMPLTGENRVLTACGIQELQNTEHQGLARVLGRGKVDAKKIGWELAPLLNSPGRFGKADLTADFFILDGTDRGMQVLESIQRINEERKELIQDSLKNLSDPMEGGTCTDMGGYVVARFEDIPDGMAGLIANRLMDREKKPVIVLIYPAKNELIKGSGRGPSSVDFLSIVEPFASFFERIGGHAQAFGFSIREDRIDEVLQKISEQIDSAGESGHILEIDLELGLEEVNRNLLNSLQKIEPFGKGNEEPLILTRNVVIDSFYRFGRDNTHGRYSVNGEKLTAIGWGMADVMEAVFQKGRPVDFVYSLEENIFRGMSSIRMMIKDMD